jgi:hypothetical protein
LNADAAEITTEKTMTAIAETMPSVFPHTII